MTLEHYRVRVEGKEMSRDVSVLAFSEEDAMRNIAQSPYGAMKIISAKREEDDE
jgi:hypothetical protein